MYEPELTYLKLLNAVKKCYRMNI